LIIEAGFETFFSENAATAEEMLKAIPQSEIEGKSFLFPCGNRSLRVIPEKLKGVANVREVVVYKTVATDFDEMLSDKIKEKLDSQKFAAICFFSPSGVEGFLEKFPQFCQNKIKLATIGTTTAKRAAEKNLRVDFIPAKPTAEVFANGLAQYLRKEI
jgi:uroporphyrinogen-III synthase